jgi:phosphate transport system substrate-binding protein
MGSDARRMQATRLTTVLAAGSLALAVGACGDTDVDAESSTSGGRELSGAIRIDGSSTVYPFAQAAAEQFMAENPKVNVSVGQSGTGGGFEKFCAGETDISDASRPIKDDEEAPLCKKGGVEYEELQVANDGIAVVTNRALDIDCMTTAQLKALWATDEIKRYSLFGPGTDSGTFDFFTDEINGEEGRTRKDYQPSEDDNVLVQGVSGDERGLGYFGFSYYEQNQDKLNLVAIDAGDGCVKPSKETIQSGEYKPLGRPVFMYPSRKALGRPEVKAFMDFVAQRHAQIADAAQMVPMNAEQAAKTVSALEGSV